jgi:hypothetical protein
MNAPTKQFAIYRYEFHKAAEVGFDTPDGTKHIKQARACFASLFDLKTIDHFSKESSNGDHTCLSNDVLRQQDEITMWRVNNKKMMKLWRPVGKDSRGIDQFEQQEMANLPFCYVLIDNRPERCLMAVEVSDAWGHKPDSLVDVVRDNFNRRLSSKFGLAIDIRPCMKVMDVWDFMRERIRRHDDYVKRVSFTFHNPNKVGGGADYKSPNRWLNNLLRMTEETGALQSTFAMTLGPDSTDKILERKCRNLVEVIRLCGSSGYDLQIAFAKYYAVYRVNDNVRACAELKESELLDFEHGQTCLDLDNTESDQQAVGTLAVWFNQVDQDIKQNYCDEGKIPRRRSRKNP